MSSDGLDQHPLKPVDRQFYFGDGPTASVPSHRCPVCSRGTTLARRDRRCKTCVEAGREALSLFDDPEPVL